MVPVNSGTAPKAPDDPTWSLRIAVWGLHSRPKRNCVIGTSRKKRIASNSTEKTMPTVVKTAMLDATISRPRTIFSTRFRARKSGRILDQATAPLRTASATAKIASSRWLVWRSSTYRSPAPDITSSTCPATTSPEARLRTLFRNRFSSPLGSDCTSTGNSSIRMLVIIFGSK